MIFDIVEFAIIGIIVTISCWGLYNVPILATGVVDYCKNRQKTKNNHFSHELLPTFSILVPVKNEENVIGRLLAALSKLNYPADKREIVIVEDGSTDKTQDICMNYAKEHKNVTILHRPFSTGKPSALNYGLAHAKGDLVAIFDADNVPDANVLTTVLEYFQDPSVAAVQGKTLSINPKENMLTQFISYEEAVYGEVYLRGKDLLNLFVHLKGSCQFIRRDVLEKLNGFNENVLSEDIEISARLTKNNYRIRYASDVVAWQESPSKLKTLFKQRTRWFRGITELSFKYGTLMARLRWKNLDAEATLFAPFILISSLLPYLLAVYALFTVFPSNVLLSYVLQFGMITTTLSLLICGFALVYATKPLKIRNILWLPFVYFYWSLQAFIALYAVFLILLRRPKKWIKTDKTGLVSKQTPNQLATSNDVKKRNECVVIEDDGIGSKEDEYQTVSVE
jgi:cellulose synthase/poly-beta-1,6-N-acetylglucosamine synthase-like glycosyltransferase